MSMSNLSTDGEFRYIVQWFNEWSELQREDFIPVLVDCLNQDTPGVVYVNGMVNAVAHSDIADKPMSLFQCRVKLFREWTTKWPSVLKHALKEKIIEIDAKVGERIVTETKSAYCNGLESQTGIEAAENEFTTMAARADVHLAPTLSDSNETIRGSDSVTTESTEQV